jgi:hypothetical protein
MKLTTLSAAVAAVVMFAHSAEARENYRHHARHREAREHHFVHRDLTTGPYGYASQQEYSYPGQQFASSEPNRLGASLGGRPAAWCGWEMRQLVSSDPGPAFNLARNWAHWGQSGPVGVGAVVVWPHHVGKIVGQQDGQWVVQSGNDGHAVRTRPRSLAGVIAVRWG